jgi:predicted transcriptional regulator
MKGAKNQALSRMEIYLAVIRVLDNGDAITQQQVMRKAGLNIPSTNEFFNFLVKLDIIREKNLGYEIAYFITNKGQRLNEYFGLDEDKSRFGGTGIFRID